MLVLYSGLVIAFVPSFIITDNDISAFSKMVKISGQEYQLNLIDTAGQVGIILGTVAHLWIIRHLKTWKMLNAGSGFLF